MERAISKFLFLVREFACLFPFWGGGDGGDLSLWADTHSIGTTFFFFFFFENSPFFSVEI